MKHLTILLFLILVSCKSEIKPKPETQAETKIDVSVTKIWNSYIKSYPEFKKDDLPKSWYFHNNKEDANRLTALVVNGKKQAGSSLYQWYKNADADLPKAGTKHIITNFEGKAQAIIEIRKVDTIPFNKISKEYAKMDMGTTIDPLKKWKKAHWDFFVSTMEGSQEKPTEDMLIVCEMFETIWTEKQQINQDF